MDNANPGYLLTPLSTLGDVEGRHEPLRLVYWCAPPPAIAPLPPTMAQVALRGVRS